MIPQRQPFHSHIMGCLGLEVANTGYALIAILPAARRPFLLSTDSMLQIKGIVRRCVYIKLCLTNIFTNAIIGRSLLNNLFVAGSACNNNEE